MKHLTKEWYLLKRQGNLALGLRRDEKSAVRNDELFAKRYARKLGQFIRNERACSVYHDQRKALTHLGEYACQPGLTEEERQRREQYKQIYYELHREEIETGKFCKFDKKRTARVFAAIFDERMELCRSLPPEIYNAIADPRMFSLGYADKKVYETVQDYSRRKRSQAALFWRLAKISGARALNRLPEKLELNDYTDTALLGIERAGRDLILAFDSSPLRVIEGEIVEMEAEIFAWDPQSPFSPLTLSLAAELHYKNGRFELHFLLDNIDGNGVSRLWYLTVEGRGFAERA